MTVGAVYDGAPEVDFFSLHNRKPKTIDVEMLDYAYVAKCSDLDELKGILALLRSGKEGRYPQLEKATEDRILAVLPAKERVKIERMRSGPSDNELVSEKEKLASWTTQADEMHKALQDQKNSAGGRRLPPVRGQKAPELSEIESTKAKPLITEIGTDPKPQKKAIPAYDFRAWEKYDVDKAINEIDESDHRAQEQARLLREEKEKRERDRKKELAALPAYVDVNSMSEAERKVLARVEKEKGNDSFRANENEEAVLYYTRSMAFDDSEAVLYSNRAAAHLRLKNFAQAEEDCSRAILLDPVYCKAWRRRGMTRFRRGKYAEAIEDFKHSLELEPGNIEVEKLLKKTVAKWKEVDGTVEVGVSDNQVSHSTSKAVESPQQMVPQSTTAGSAGVGKPFKRFEIIEEEDEDDDANAPVEKAAEDDEDDEDDDDDPDEKPFQRFEIIEE